MPVNDLRPIPLFETALRTAPEPVPWLWHGYLMPGDVTLLTSTWKTGKTTLLTGLLQRLGDGGPFLGREVRPGRAWVVSEESRDLWADRVRRTPVGPHVCLLSRPFLGRPTAAEWEAVIELAAAARAAGDLDLFVVDPLASFLSSPSESESTVLLAALRPLHRLTTAGVAVLLLHHPRKKSAEAGSTARGSGALLGFVDITVELTPYSRLKSDAHRRRLFAQGRRPETPTRLAYEWDADTGEFRPVTDAQDRQFDENWAAVLGVLRERTAALTVKEIWAAWPDPEGRPSVTTLYHWLHLALAKGWVRREGKGTWPDPWRYRPPAVPDRDHGELPPLPPLSPLPGWSRPETQ